MSHWVLPGFQHIDTLFKRLYIHTDLVLLNSLNIYFVVYKWLQQFHQDLRYPKTTL